MRRRAEPSKRAAAACLAALLPALAGAAGPAPAAVCDKPVYLTFDTGHMGVAPLVADVLARHHVKVTFFLANERTLTDGASLDDQWAPWWKARAAEGHAFGSHTYDHVYWQGDLPDGKFRVKPSAGPQTGKVQTWTAQQYCEEIKRSSARFTQMTGHAMLPCTARRAARPRRRCSRRRANAATSTWAGRRPVSWATSCPATNSPTPACWSRRCATSSPATSCWPTWASGRARTPGPRRAGAAG